MAYLALALERTLAFARRSKARGASREPPPSVTILKPLRGATHELRQNLASFIDQDYPDFEVIFAIAETADPAGAVTRDLIANAPQRRLRLVVGGSHVAANRKVANLMNALDVARGEVLVIADADVRVEPDYVRNLVSELLAPNVGAVTCLYGALPTATLWSRLGAAFVEERFAPSVLVALALEPLHYAFGATIALRRTTLAAIGGFAALADTAADDHRLGALVAARGLRVALSSCLVRTIVDEPSLAALWSHELRWARTIRAVRPVGFAGSLLTHGCALALAAVLLAPRALGPRVVLVTASALRLWLGAAARRAFGGSDRGRVAPTPIRDALDLAIWLAAFFGRTARWQDQTLSLGADGQIVSTDHRGRDGFT